MDNNTAFVLDWAYGEELKIRINGQEYRRVRPSEYIVAIRYYGAIIDGHTRVEDFTASVVIEPYWNHSDDLLTVVYDGSTFTIRKDALISLRVTKLNG